MKPTPLKNRPGWHLLAGRIARVFGVFFYDLYYCEKALSQPVEPIVSSFPTSVRVATAEDRGVIICRVGEEARGVFDHATAIGSTCYVALHEDTITGYLWVNRQIIDLVGMYVAKLPARHSFSHDAFVFPEYRGNKIYQSLRQTVCSKMYESGCQFIACFVDKANVQPIRILEREGMDFHNAPVLKLPFKDPIHFCRVLA